MRIRYSILYHLGILDPDCDEESEDEFAQILNSFSLNLPKWYQIITQNSTVTITASMMYEILTDIEEKEVLLKELVVNKGGIMDKIVIEDKTMLFLVLTLAFFVGSTITSIFSNQSKPKFFAERFELNDDFQMCNILKLH